MRCRSSMARIDVLGGDDRDEALTRARPTSGLRAGAARPRAARRARPRPPRADAPRVSPRLPIVVLSATHDRATVGSALGAGARGFIAKTSTPEELLDALRTVLGGGSSVTTDFAPAAAGASVACPDDVLGLTHRQADVLRLLVQGKPNKLICRDLRLSEGTVKVHVSAILKALNVRSRAQAIAELSAARRDHRRRAFGAERH